MSTKAGSTKERGEMEKERVKRQTRQTTNGLSPIKMYLVAYNLISAFLWLNLLVLTLSSIISHPTPPIAVRSNNPITRLLSTQSSILPSPLSSFIQRLGDSYHFGNLGTWTKYTQSLAVLDVVHAVMGWTRSPLFTTVSQVYSRLWTVWGVVEANPEIHSSPLFTTMLSAWSVTEVIRYSYYAFNVLGISSYWLDYLRYTTFIPLYPLGASSEAFLAWKTLPSFSNFPCLPSSLTALSPFSTILSYLPASVGHRVMKSQLGRTILWKVAQAGAKSKAAAKGTWGTLEVWTLLMFCIWWPSLYMLYAYMFSQRRKVLGKGRVVGQKKTV